MKIVTSWNNLSLLEMPSLIWFFFKPLINQNNASLFWLVVEHLFWKPFALHYTAWWSTSDINVKIWDLEWLIMYQPRAYFCNATQRTMCQVIYLLYIVTPQHFIQRCLNLRRYSNFCLVFYLLHTSQSKLMIFFIFLGVVHKLHCKYLSVENYTG